LGKTDEFQGVIERVKHSIDDPRWEIKLKYLLALWYAIDKNDELSSFKVLQEIDIAQCKDTDLLALYLQVSTNRIKFTESISIADRIIENTKKESYLLQYSLVKATFYFLSCQYEDAKEIIDKAVRNFRDLPADKQSSYGRLLFAYSLEFYGKSTHNSDLLFEAEQTTRQLISEYSDDEYTKDYIADLFKLLGDCELSQSKHIEAIKSYNASLEVKQSDLTKVFLVRALCGNNDLPEAKELLQSIQSEFLDDEGKFDLSVSWAIVAAISQASEDISKAKSLLKTASANHPIFSQQRDKLLIELLEIRPKSALGRFGQIIQTINKYIILNPNFFGIGINLNQIIDDTESKIPKKPR
jgi:tetratricopeptide (TPR) repeat protein